MTLLKIKYKGNLRTQATHLKSNNKLITDAPTDNHGKGEAFSPTDLLATSLGTCMITVMGIAANKNGIAFTDAEMEVEKIMASGPRRVKEVKMTLKIKNHDYTTHQKKQLEEVAVNCPVAKSLHPDLAQNIEFSYY